MEAVGNVFRSFALVYQLHRLLHLLRVVSFRLRPNFTPRAFAAFTPAREQKRQKLLYSTCLEPYCIDSGVLELGSPKSLFDISTLWRAVTSVPSQ